MPTPRTAAPLEDQPVPIRTTLVAAWTSFMFLYIYVDYFVLYTPGTIDDLRDGVVWQLDITQTFLVGALALVGVPILMVVLSATLPARALRTTTLVVAPLYVLVSAFNVVDEEWTVFFVLGAALEIALLALVMRTTWTWPAGPRPDGPVRADRPLQATRTS